MNHFNRFMPDYTIEEIQLLKTFIFASGMITGMWTDLDFEFLDSTKNLSHQLIIEPWRKDALMLRFDKLPLYLTRDLNTNHWYTQIWSLPVIKWRLQIGK